MEEKDIIREETEEFDNNPNTEDDTAQTREDTVTSQEDNDKKSKKKNKADKKNDAMKERVEELEDKVKRQLAEFENFRNRTEREKSMMFENGAKSVIEKILPIVDNFERGIDAIPESEKDNPTAQGMEMIYKQLISELDKLEVKPIEAVGQEFNPDFHNALMQVQSDEYESGIVASELQKGYTYRGQVLRHSLVSVVE